MKKEYYTIEPQVYDNQFWWKKDDIEFWKNIFYDSEKYGWRLMKREHFQPFIESIINKIQSTFNTEYNNENRPECKCDELDTYLELVQKIMVAKNKTIMNSVYKSLIC